MSAGWRVAWVLVTVAALAAAGAGLWDFGRNILWVGSFELTVHIESPAGQPRVVACRAAGDRSHAEEVPPWSGPAHPWVTADPFDGRPITVYVMCSGRTSGFGRELSYSQYRCLLVTAVFPNGRRVEMLVDIPDSQQSREVWVTLPV